MVAWAGVAAVLLLAGQDLAALTEEILEHGQQVRYVQKLADEIGHRLTGSPNGERAELALVSWLKELSLESPHLEGFPMPGRWTRGPLSLRVLRPVERALTAASYTWTPGTEGVIEAPVVDVGAASAAEVAGARSRLRGAIALFAPRGATLDAVITNFYRTPDAVRELAEAGAVAVLIASDKERTLLFTAPVAFDASVAPLPTLSLAAEDVLLLRRLLARGSVELALEVKNTLGPPFTAHNVAAEIRGSDKPEEVVLLGAHLDSNDLGPGALDNAAGCAALLEIARAFKALRLTPRRTVRFVFFGAEEEGMIGSTAYVRQHVSEMDQLVAALIMDIGAGKPQGWFSMGRTDLDPELGLLMTALERFSGTAIEHAAFAATDNAAFMAAGVPNLVLVQDEQAYDPVHHTAADTPDKIGEADYAAGVATVAGMAYQIATRPQRFGRRLTAAEVEKMMQASGIEAQWRAAHIWPLN